MSSTYYKRRNINMRMVRNLCQQLGLHPCTFSHLRAVLGIIDALKMKP